MNLKELNGLKEIIFYDLECLELKPSKDNLYHYTLLKDNLKDLFNELLKGGLK